MKANEAPEKIYINPNLENRTWLIGKGDISFIEYTRTEAFIEKACEWLRYNNDLIDGDVDDYVEDFKNYLLKGE